MVLRMHGVKCFLTFSEKTIDPHRISQSFLGVWEGSLENVLTTNHHRAERLPERLLKSSTWKERFFPPYIFSLYHLNSIFFHVSLKLRCNGRQARGEKKGIGIQRIQLKIELILEVNEVNKCKNILCVIQKLAFCLPPMEMKIGSAKSDIKTVQTCIRCYCSLIIAMFFYFQFNFLQLLPSLGWSVDS